MDLITLIHYRRYPKNYSLTEEEQASLYEQLCKELVKLRERIAALEATRKK